VKRLGLRFSKVWWGLFFTTLSVWAQPRLDDPGFIQLTAPQATQVLNDFRASRLSSDLCLQFTITHQPRQGESSAPIPGLLWATWNRQGPQLRVEIPAHGQTPRLAFLASKSTSESKFWISQGDEAPRLLTNANLNQPLANGLLLTPFDIALPFTHWANTHYTNTERSRGRPVHFFVATNPTGESPATVEFGLDRVYNALVIATYRNAQKQNLRQVQIEEFAKVDDQWLIGSCSVRDEATRDVDVLRFTGASLQLQIPPELFEASSLHHQTPAPSQLKPL
jgi:hypothetical protein